MNLKKGLGITLLLLITQNLLAQQLHSDPGFRRYFIGSTFALLGNLDRKASPDFVQLNFGYRLTPQDAISVELKTWKYEWSLGIPWSNFQAPEEKFLGHIREFGIALAYQRFIYKGLYTAVHVMSAKQAFVNSDKLKIGDGFQIFNTYRLGYQFQFADNRFFIEPSAAITHRPFHTEMPDTFKALDDKWPKYFIGEPGLHFGFNF